MSREELERLPSVRFSFGRDSWRCDCYELGIAWGKDLDAPEGEYLYRHAFVIRWKFYLWVDRR